MTHEEQIAKLTEMLVIQQKLHETAIDMLKPAIEAEREACAKIIDDSYETTTPGQGIPEDWLLTLSEAIRARGQA